MVHPQPDPDEAEEIRLFLEAICNEYGYDLRNYAPRSMQRRLHTALAKSGVRTLAELRSKVLSDPIFFGHVLDDLTVRVSEMFRDPTFYLTFRRRVVPLLRTYPLLNVWHCGCATGEEAYSTAILLAEEGLYERTQLYATDINSGALAFAKQGVYPESRAAQFGRNYQLAGGTGALSQYYTAAYDGIALRESLRRKILFFQHDLVCDQVFGEMHVIFCRNVLIYFQPELRSLVLEKLNQSARPAGFLCLGGSERLPRADAGLFTEFAPEERIYRQRPDTRG